MEPDVFSDGFLIWGIMILNSMLALYGMLGADYVFAPFLWNAVGKLPYGQAWKKMLQESSGWCAM